jgi:hypothetical protein
MNFYGVFSASISDTIPGRQCMASCFFLLKQFDDVLIYLNSFKVSRALSMWLFVWNSVNDVSQVKILLEPFFSGAISDVKELV